MPFSPADQAWLSTRGISPEESLRQVTLLEQGTVAPVLERAASLHDGIAELAPAERDHWVKTGREAGRSIGFFVPASGAASRMFAGLKALQENPAKLEQDPAVKTLLATPAVHTSLTAFNAPATATQSVTTLLTAPPEGLGWPSLPKAFLPFHMQDDQRTQTAIEAQMQESCTVLGPGSKGTLHCSLSPEHLAKEPELKKWIEAISRTNGCTLEFIATVQESSTDTLALAADGEIARDKQGNPLLRAGGHGSLLANLARTPGEVILVKNIDNIQPHWRQEHVVPWRLALAGIALELRRRGDALLTSAPGSSQESEHAEAFATLLAKLGRKEKMDATSLRSLADRPLRAAGMVRNDGAPGGGPFWVAGKGLQIVEQSEVSPESSQQAILGSATHFNPVDMACCLNRPDGSRYDLETFRDPTRAFIAAKPDGKGGTLQVLEHPGLWNGSMGEWLTVFVEVPPDTFLPAKTVFDLSHPWRQSPEGI
ncbi:MAG: hypothetical protein RL318_1300 [Fibrobacterota bacterium]|jgi:hypothetical protein